jgi:hypothetical protein
MRRKLPDFSRLDRLIDRVFGATPFATKLERSDVPPMQTRFSGARKPPAARPQKVTSVKRRAKEELSPSKGLPRAGSPDPSLLFSLARGQVWKTDEAYLQILDVGKTLVHYRRAVRPDTKGTPVKINSREEIQVYLRKNRAVLVTDAAFKTR